MRIAVIGGGAAGMVTAHYLNKKHDVTIYEKQPILGGNVRTLNKNVQTGFRNVPEGSYIDNGVIEFDKSNFHAFHGLMNELGVDMEEVSLTTGLFTADGNHYLSPYRIFHTDLGWPTRFRESIRLMSCLPDFASFMLGSTLRNPNAYKGRPVSDFFGEHVYHRWLKMLLMYAYSIPFAQVDDMPAELGVPVMRRCSLFTRWSRIKNGVYTYMEQILEQFDGTVRTDADITMLRRDASGISLKLSTGEEARFDKIVFAVPPDQVLKLLSDPSDDEVRRFQDWKENVAHTAIHSDRSIYDDYRVTTFSAFDVFEKSNRDAGYNGFLNPLVGIPDDAAERYNLAFNLDDRIDKKQVMHVQEHRTPLYTVDAFRYRDEIIRTNGENHTFHAGAYLDDGLHEGAVKSAQSVARLLGCLE